MAGVISAEAIATRLSGLEQIGIVARGVERLAWTPEDEACRRWFFEQSAAAGFTAARDPAGNLWAQPGSDPRWWAVGSHLDSVRGGGRFDGPLGVACGFEIAVASSAPVAVISFADEEGARFNTPTFGSKALAGKLNASMLDRHDDEGIPLADAMRGAGVDPTGLLEAPSWLSRLRGFVEVHIDQTTDLARAGAPVGVVRSLAARRRLEVEFQGRADHAGTTPVAERRDALSASARVIVTAEELARGLEQLTVTSSRMIVEPNAPTTIASRVKLWIDARAPHAVTIDRWQAEFEAAARLHAGEARVEIDVHVASRSEGVEFDAALRRQLGQAAETLVGSPVPELVCFAGHDAGVLAEKIPAAMVLVRNPTGVSHSPDEDVDLADAALAATAVQRALAGAGR